MVNLQILRNEQYFQSMVKLDLAQSVGRQKDFNSGRPLMIPTRSIANICCCFFLDPFSFHPIILFSLSTSPHISLSYIFFFFNFFLQSCNLDKFVKVV